MRRLSRGITGTITFFPEQICPSRMLRTSSASLEEHNSTISGSYGSNLSSTSIFNQLGRYGSKLLPYSPFNTMANHPLKPIHYSSENHTHAETQPVLCYNYHRNIIITQEGNFHSWQTSSDSPALSARDAITLQQSTRRSRPKSSSSRNIASGATPPHCTKSQSRRLLKRTACCKIQPVR